MQQNETTPIGYMDLRLIERPEYSDWQCDVFSDGGQTMTIRPQKGKEPNRFHRFMQSLIFGVTWRKVKP